MKQRCSIPRTNPARRRRLYAEQYGKGGAKGAFVRARPCVVTLSSVAGYVTCGGAIEATHIKSKGAGGKSQHLVSMCASHHRLLHKLGRRTFEETYLLNLDALARDCEFDWQVLQQKLCSLCGSVLVDGECMDTELCGGRPETEMT